MGFWKDVAGFGMAKAAMDNDKKKFIENAYLYSLEEEKELMDEELFDEDDELDMDEFDDDFDEDFEDE